MRSLLLLTLVACDGGAAALPRSTTSFVADVDASVEEEIPVTRPDGQFIATRESFKGYLGWTSFFLGDTVPDGGVHVNGPRYVYINRMPPQGSKKFPVGTIIVKVIKNGEPAEWQVFAMVKRGGDYNLFGAVEWEWFELKHTDAERFTIKWNGVKAPSGEGYGGLGGGACNACHSGAFANDYVHSPPLTLQ